MAAPTLTRVTRNIYNVTVLSEVEMLTSGALSFVFRIEDSSQPGELVYQWMVDVSFDVPNTTVVEYLLDLTSYSGRSLNIAYAFATNMGLSEFSEYATVQVPGK